MVTLFTFGCGARGELGLPRADDRCRPEANAVAFPHAQHPGAIESQITAIALGSDHSLAVVGGNVYRWGLLVSYTLPHWQTGTTGAGEVVPLPAPLTSWSLRDGAVQSAADVAELSGKVYSVACGGSNSYVLTNQGEVFIFGDLRPPGGDAGSIRRLWGSPNGRVLQVVAGWRHCLLLTESGEIFAFGDDEYGQCAGAGNGDVRLPLPTSLAVAGIAAGACHSMAWDASGSAFAWGHGGNGRLGLGSSEHCRAPRQIVTLLEPVFFASCGANFSLFATQRGRALWACGGNQYGQLGLGGTQRSSHEVPVQLDLPRRNEEIVSLECGVHHAICLTCVPVAPGRALERRVAWAWGCASSGQCGLAPGERRGETLPQSRSAPEPLVDFLAPSPYWPLAVAAGRSHSAVLAQTRHHVATAFESAPIPMAPNIAGALSINTVRSPESSLRATASAYPGHANATALQAVSWDAAVEAMTSPVVANVGSAPSWSVPSEVPPPPPWFASKSLHANSPYPPLQHSQSAPHLARAQQVRSELARKYTVAAPAASDSFGDDIIDTFCAALAPSQAPRCLNFHSLVCSPPPSAVPQPCLRASTSPARTPERLRSLSPVAALVELGEAMLRGDDFDGTDDGFYTTQSHSLQLRSRDKRLSGFQDSKYRCAHEVHRRPCLESRTECDGNGHGQKQLRRSTSDFRAVTLHHSSKAGSSQSRPRRMVMSSFLGRSAALEADRIGSRCLVAKDAVPSQRSRAREPYSLPRYDSSSRHNASSRVTLHRSSSDSRLERTRDSRNWSRRDVFHGSERYASQNQEEYERSDFNRWPESSSMSDYAFDDTAESESNAGSDCQRPRRHRKAKKTKDPTTAIKPLHQPFNPFKQYIETFKEPAREVKQNEYASRASADDWQGVREQNDYAARTSADDWRGVRESVNDLTSMIAGMTASLSPQSRFEGGMSLGFGFGLGYGLSSPFMGSNYVSLGLDAHQDSPVALDTHGPLILTDTTDLQEGRGFTPDANQNTSDSGHRISVSGQSARMSMRRNSRRHQNFEESGIESEEPKQSYRITQPYPPITNVHTKASVCDSRASTPTHPPAMHEAQVDPEPFEVNGGQQNARASPTTSATRTVAPAVNGNQTKQRSPSKASSASSPSCKFTPCVSAFAMEEIASTPSDSAWVSRQSPMHASLGPSLQGSHPVSHNGSLSGSPMDTHGSPTTASHHDRRQPSKSKDPTMARPTSLSPTQLVQKNSEQKSTSVDTHQPLLLGGHDEEFQQPSRGWDVSRDVSTSSSVGARGRLDKTMVETGARPSENPSHNPLASRIAAETIPAISATEKIPLPSTEPSKASMISAAEESVQPFHDSGSSSDEPNRNDKFGALAKPDQRTDAQSDSSKSSRPGFEVQHVVAKHSSGASSDGSDSGSDSGSSSGGSSDPNPRGNTIVPNSARTFSPGGSSSSSHSIRKPSSNGSSGSSSGGPGRPIATVPQKISARKLSSGTDVTSDAGESSASNSPPKTTAISKVRLTEDTIVQSLSDGDSGSDSDLEYTRTASRDVDVPVSATRLASSSRTAAPASLAVPSPRTPRALAPTSIAAPPHRPTPACEDDMGIESLSD